MRCLGPVLFLLAALRWGGARAQDATIFAPPATLPVVRAVPAGGEVRVDGRLDEAAWRRAPVIRGFRQVEPNQGQPARPDTQVRIIFDAKNLYIGAFCPDSLGRAGVRAPDMRRDFDYFEQDLFGVAFDAFRTRRNATAFQVNPYGAQRDLQVFDDNLFDREWDAYWKVRTTRTDSGWVAEMQLPWATLRYPSSADTTAGWLVNFNRIARRQNQISGLPGYPRAYSTYRMGYVAELRGLRPPPAGANLRVEPYVVVQQDRRRAGPGPATVDNTFKAGGDLKWAINPHSVLDLTLNTDFAQADADRQVINLRRFNVLFPERRQFFLENAGLLAPATPLFQPFFSRSIGLGDNGLPLPLTGGARFTSRTAERGIGALYVRQRGVAPDSARGPGQAPAHFAVARYVRNFGEQNNAGLLLTSRTDQAANGQDYGQNTTLTTDGLWRPSQPLTLTWLVSGSASRGQRGAGLGAHLSASYNTNQVFAQTQHSLITAGYRPSMGFVARPDLLYHGQVAGVIYRPAWKPSWVRSIEPYLTADTFQGAADGRFQEGAYALSPLFLLFQTGGFAELQIEHNRQRLPVDFTPVGLIIGRGDYAYNRLRATISNDPSGKLFGRLSGSTGGYFDGRLHQLAASLRYSPSAHVALRLDGEYNALRAVGLTRQDQNAWLLGPEARLALNPRVLLTAFYQYSSAARLARWNVRGSWEFQPLSYVFLVFNDLADRALDTQQQQSILKVSYLKQF